ncbi:heme biosynthesis protein HemY [Frigidibacter sp. RF13]|uniref:heme biosynthesis protein HemY n=1 Tax=Frigidibacter sp. RF13 TaxID=2997340 RepID=UPI00226D66E3|nr:heme biosynthesis HemY N-terminal domain-containing protein [Frigidibacter sp. RF13]MCY1126461.1 heme biosynthesis protein HemY [Frigidibacter sp. RF13]
MIWSFAKIALFVALVAGLTLTAGYFADQGGGIRIAVAHQEFTLGPVQSVVGILLALLALWLALKVIGFAVAILRFINGDETAISRYFDRSRERKGYEALTEGMMALAAGDGTAALSHAARAGKYLDRPALTNLLSAQAAEAAGDGRKATEAYKRLLGDERTRFAGVRGLLKQKLTEGDRDTALKLAEKAFLMRPSNPEVQDALFDLQAESGDWAGARKVLGAKLKHGHLPKDVHRRRDAILALQEARAVFEDDLPVEAREAAIAANKQSPDLIPAAVLAAHGYQAQGKTKYALRILKKAWEVLPHPDLAAAFAALEPTETPRERLKRFDLLFSANPDHEETRLLKAELNIAAEEFPAARRALGDLPERHPTTRALTIMAAIERGEGEEDAVVRGWLTRALSASRGPQWICDKCQHVNAVWSPTCDHCGSFDTLSWREQSQTPSGPSAADLLPLVVGGAAAAEPAAPADTPDEPTEPQTGAVYEAEFIEANGPRSSR